MSWPDTDVGRPERATLYRLVQQHLETWLARADDPDCSATIKVRATLS